MTQLELNKKLYKSIMAKKIDFIAIENLLKLGADPLGSSDENDPTEHILGELFCQASNDSKLAEKMPQIIQMFYDYGMNIESKNIPDDGDDVNPLWSLQFVSDENGLKMLKVLLDNGLDFESAEILIDHIFIDMEVCDGCEIEDVYFLNATICSLKMIMLVASYPQIIKKSVYIRKCIDVENNNPTNLFGFRIWDDFEYHIDISTGTNKPHGLQNATLTIKDKRADKNVWSFLI